MRSQIEKIRDRIWNDKYNKAVESINGIDHTREHDITIEEVKACAMFAHFTDEEAREVIRTLKQFTVIVFNFYQKKRQNALLKE